VAQRAEIGAFAVEDSRLQKPRVARKMWVVEDSGITSVHVPEPDRLPPSGTVTFLFTDIEGSTRLWEQQHAAMQLALARHDAILRDAIEANRGYLFKTTGDGAHAAFATAADALVACLAAQRALTANAWGEVRIRSRMALHSGAAEQRDGDYFGPALNRTARLMAAGHGGQILLSLATEELVRDHLPANIALRDMGERRLKDLIRPERVYQVITPELPADFPPLRTLDARPNNLPAQTTPFIGREAEIRAVKEQLSKAQVRLLTLSGVGGTGKTRLALQAAADMVDDFEHGVYFVALAALSDAGLVPQTIAQAFGVREAAGRPLKEQLQDHLREKQMLLVLDNFEQVIDAASLISDLLSAAPRLKVLVTSREVLRLYGEANYPVLPLAAPDPERMLPLEQFTQYEAVALFIDRALAVNPTFAVTNENAPAVAEICHRLEGLPLAIELAAARARVLPPQRMLTELSHRLSFLMGGARGLPARQKTLRGAIDWSHDLLTGDEQKLFSRLAVFVGGAALDAIEPICNLENNLNILDTVESLVSKSLVKQTEAYGEPRFLMLETIREYAGERLKGTDDEHQVRQRHRDYFLALAREATAHLSSAEQVEWLDRLQVEHDNLRAALDWRLAETGSVEALLLCGTLSRFWWTRGHLSEGRARCARVLEKTGNEQWPRERAAALNGAGALAYYQGDFPAARGLYEESLALFKELGDQKDIAVLLNNLGNAAIELGDYPGAQRLYEESLVIRRQMGDRIGIATSLSNLGNAVAEQGDYATARALAEESLALDRQSGDRSGIAISLNNLGDFACEQGDYLGAKSLYTESLAIKRELGDRGGVAITLNGLGNVLAEQGDYRGARLLYAESLAIRRQLGDRRGIAYSLEGLAAIVTACGPLHAARVWGAAERLREEIRAPLPPNERPRYDRRVAAARTALKDDVAFDRAWLAGRSLTLEQATQFALETVERTSE
jgi:predicted ATPase/class 3 adenylate cyclase